MPTGDAVVDERILDPSGTIVAKTDINQGNYAFAVTWPKRSM